MKETTVFRAQFIIAWPIWAGGYPTQEQALQVIEQNKAAIVAMFNERLHSLLGEEFFIQGFHYQIGAHAPISGLWPNNLLSNSVNLITIVGASQTVASARNLTDKIANAVEDLAGLLSAFSKERMPHAAAGANLYDGVHSRVPGFGVQLTAGSGGSQGFPSMAARMASSAAVPWAAAESR